MESVYLADRQCGLCADDVRLISTRADVCLAYVRSLGGA